MRLLRPSLTVPSIASLILLAVACSNSTTPANTTPAAGDDDGDDNNPTPDASTGDSSTAGDDAATSGDASSTADSGGPVADGGEEVACSGTAACAAGDACIADYATASVATSWCAFQQTAKRVTEFTDSCSGYHVVEIGSGVVGALTIDYYDLTTGALVAVLDQTLNTEKNCSGTPPEVSSSPCGDAQGVTTELATTCTD